MGLVAAIETVCPLSEIARQMLGADTVMGANQLGFDVAEGGMNDREELGCALAIALYNRGAFQMVAKCHSFSLVTFEPIGQQMRFGDDIGLDERPQFGAGGGRPHGDPRGAGVKGGAGASPRGHAHHCRLGRRDLIDRDHDQALLGVCRAASGTCRTTSAADECLIRFDEALERSRPILPQPMTQLMCEGPRGLVGDPECTWPTHRACRHPSNARRGTTSATLSASDGRLCPRSPIPGGGNSCTRMSEAKTAVAMLNGRYIWGRHNPQASEVSPDDQWTPPQSHAGPRRWSSTRLQVGQYPIRRYWPSCGL